MNREDAIQVLRQQGWLSTLPSGMQEACLAGAKLRTLAKGEQMFGIDDDPRIMFGVADGSIGAYLSYNPHEVRLVMLYDTGSWGGDAAIITGNPHRGTVIARSECTCLTIPASHVYAISAHHPEIWRMISLNVAFQFDSLSMLAEVAQCRTPADRLITLMLSLCKMNPRQTEFELSNDEIGQMIGLTRNTVGKGLGQLEELGLIERGYAHVTVRDVALLQQEIAKRA